MLGCSLNVWGVERSPLNSRGMWCVDNGDHPLFPPFLHLLYGRGGGVPITYVSRCCASVRRVAKVRFLRFIVASVVLSSEESSSTCEMGV